MAFCPEHPKWDQNRKFQYTPKRDDEHPRSLHKGVPHGHFWTNKKGTGAGMRPATVSGMVTREASVNGKFCRSQVGSVLFSFLMANGFLRATFRLKENLVPRVRVTLVKKSWERDWFLECSCQTCVKLTSEPQGKIVGLAKMVSGKLCPCLKTFGAPFLLSQLFYPGPPRMLLTQKFIFHRQQKFWLFSS